MSQDAARLFLALWPDAGVRSALTRYRDAWRWNPGAAVVAPQNLHLTLHFIGDVPSKRLSLLRKRLRVPFQAFDLHLGTPAIWHRDIAILRPDAMPENLRQLHAGLAEALLSLDLGIEARSFHPHVTFARRSAGAALPPQPAAIDWPVSDYALVESRLSSKAAEYVVIEKYPSIDV